MTRVLCFASILLVGSAIAVIVVIAVGRAQPSSVALWFTNPDGSPCQRPCLFGIRPNVTSLNQAIGLLNTHPLMRAVGAHYDPMKDFESNTYTFSSDSMTLVLTINDGVKAPITGMALNFAHDSSNTPTAGDALAYLGPPHTVQAAAIYSLWFDTPITLVLQPSSQPARQRPLALNDKIMSLWVTRHQ